MNFLGIGSGLDLSTMLTQLVQVASEPKIQQLGSKEAGIRDSISGLGTLSSLLSSYQDAADDLKSSSAFNQRTAEVTQPSGGDVLTATADTDAVTGSYDISVEALAQGTKGYTSQINTDHTASVGIADTLTFSVPDGSISDFSISITGTMSLEDIRNEINSASDNFGVEVNVVDGRLVYESTVTGDAAQKQLSVVASNSANSALNLGDHDYGGGVGSYGTITQNAQQAHIKVDNIDVYGDDNTFDTEISGLTIVATKADPGQAATVGVELDTDSVKTKIEGFVDAYNDLRTGMNKLKGTTDDDGKFTPGLLYGDPILRNLESMLGTQLTQQVSGAAENFDTLYAIGLDIESDGTLSIDSDRLNDGLTDNYDNLDELFSGTTGLGTIISDQLDGYLGFTGIIQGKEDSYDDMLDDIDEQFEAHTRYIQSYQETLKQQFQALDSTIAQLNSTMRHRTSIGCVVQCLIIK